MPRHDGSRQPQTPLWGCHHCERCSPHCSPWVFWFLYSSVLENAQGQAGGKREPQFLALREVFGGDGATTDHWFCDFAHGIPRQDTIDLAHGPSAVVTSTNKQGKLT